MPSLRQPTDLLQNPRVDRRLAQRNLRTALIAGAISILIFGAAFIASLLYLG